MPFSEEYAAFLARGGKIDVIPGFTEIKPLPSREKPKRKRRVNAKPQGLLETKEGVTLLWIAYQSGYQSRSSLSTNEKAMELLPNPIGVAGPHQQSIYDKEEALLAVKRIQEFRKTSGRVRQSL